MSAATKVGAHTPGPWVVHSGSDDGFEFLDVLGSERALEVCRMGDLDAEDEANARLIAAAPDLLEAARDLADYVAMHAGRGAGTILVSVRAAIAKAEGGAS